jgi:D-xylulose kinase
MPGALFLGYDVGTQGTKALAIDVERRAVVARAASAYGLIEGLPDGHAEQHPETWARALRDVTRALGGQCELARVRGIGVSGQQHGCVLVDARGAIVRPAKLWCDTSTADEARELSERLGVRVSCGFTAPKVLWHARREPDVWKRTSLVLLPHDWVNFMLTGLATMEPGDASGTGWLDVRERRYSARALAAIDPALAGKLPPLIESGFAAGELTREGARWIGLPETCAGAVVATGGGDNMMSAIGAGATREGVAVLSLGTSTTVFAHASRPIVDPEGLIAAFCDSSGGWLPLLCVMNATGVLEEVRAAFGGSLDELTRAASAVEPGCGGVTFVPFLMGERVPDLPDARGALLGLRSGSLRPGVVFRAALEGVALNLAAGVERMRALGLGVESVRLTGGGARNALWRRILADALGARVSVLVEPETAALGGALQAAWTIERRSCPGLSLDEFAAPWVATEALELAPTAAGRSAYAALGVRFAQAVDRIV